MKHHPLYRWRVRRGVTRKTLGKLLGVHLVSISRWEHGTREVDVELLAKIQQHTGIHPADLRPDIAAIFQRRKPRKVTP